MNKLDVELLLFLLKELDLLYSYRSCNDPTYPPSWSKETIKEYEAAVSAADPDNQRQYDIGAGYEPEETLDIFDGTLVSYIINKIKEKHNEQ